MLDELKEECGIAAVVDLGPDDGSSGDATALLPGMLLDIQNRGQLAAGITSYDPERPQILRTYKRLGSVSEAFHLNDQREARELLADIRGSMAIGHTRYSTCGADDLNYAQPLERMHGKTFKWFSFCFNGNIANHRQLADHLASDLGYHLLRPDSDTELFMHYIAFQQRGQKPRDWIDVFRRLDRIVDGSWCMLLMTASGDMLIARDGTGLKPLCWGRRGRFLLAASESIALQNAGVREVYDLPPGHLLQIRDGQVEERPFAQPRKPSHCFFEWVYFANVASVLDGRSVYQARAMLGKALADLEKEQVDDHSIVVPVPDTSKASGDAFAFELGIPSMEGLVRNRYVGRTFIEADDRAAKVRRKFTALRHVLEGKKVFLVDDSIVRSTTMTYLIDYLREEGGVAELHVRIPCPPIMGPCFYGIDMSTIGELFGPRHLSKPVKRGLLPEQARSAMARAIGADSLQYLPVDRVPECLGFEREHLCMACVTRDYPTKAGRELIKQAETMYERGDNDRATTAH